MKKSFLVIFSCIICVIIFQGFSTFEKPEFKNLQILPKDISEHDLDSVMHHFTASLDVKCNFCHVRNEEAKKMDFVSDEKPEKKVARKMMLMSIDINKNYFTEMEMDHDRDHKQDMEKHIDHPIGHDTKNKMDSAGMNNSKYMLMEVTCYTCHRGDSHPDSKVPPQKESPPPLQQNPADKK
ncbi:MAG: c-type cytochrome [Ginsengibacter sp.]